MDVRVLVANSSDKVRKNIVKSLQEIGVENIVEATTGDQAINGIRTNEIDFVIAEFNTQTGGQELVGAIRKIDRELPIIVTAPQSQKLADLKKACPNATTFLTTPFTTQQLQKTVNDFVPSLVG